MSLVALTCAVAVSGLFGAASADAKQKKKLKYTSCRAVIDYAALSRKRHRR